MTRKLLLLIASFAMFFSCVQLTFAAEIGQGLTSKEVTTLLTHKTFFVKQFRGNKSDKDFHAYFGPDGSIQINYSAKQTKSGTWSIGSKGDLCFTYMTRGGSSKRGGSKSLRVTRCGTLVKRSAYSFDRMNDKGEHTATLTLVANGNKFPLR